ncbi:MAG TPA: ATP-binding protein, partial [Blastocatellia bacterium]|nr:ATP-binding protein [Blastocatellia bacterium]
TEEEGLWIATGRGLFLSKNRQLIELLPGADARCLALGEQRQHAWCATAGNGLYEFLVENPIAPRVSRLDSERGLPSDGVFAVTRIAPPGGDAVLWIGTSRGVAAYEPGLSAPILKAVRILGKRPYQPEAIRGDLVLDYPQNALLLEVAAISSRTFPEQFQYAFYLYDASGKVIKQTVSQQSQFVMDNLRPGKYRVEAVAYSNDLSPSSPLTYTFDIRNAPFPRTSAALSVLLTLALLALWWGYHQNKKLARVNTNLEDANLLLARTRLQLANETENERRRIARDLHDQTLSDLRRLMLMTDQLGGPANGEAAGFRKEIESVSTEIRHICEDLSPSVLANVGLTAALEWALADAVAHLPKERKFEYQFVCGEETEDQLTLNAQSKIQVYRIVQEAISNVCRHAEATRVSLSAEIRADRNFVVTLRDNGHGFDMAGKSRKLGRGLNNIRSRASLIDADVDWSSSPGGGTVFTLVKTQPERADRSDTPRSEQEIPAAGR